MNHQSKAKSHHSNIGHFFMACVLGVLVLFAVGCEEQRLSSSWLDREIVIDAKSDDWLDTLYYFESEMVSIGFFNDENDLYVCMLAEHPVLQAQLVGQGFTLWFDPAGGKGKTFGIKFPIGMREMRDQMDVMWTQESGTNREKMRQAFEKSLSDLEILGPGGEKRRVSVGEAKGIEIKVRSETGLFVYELKMPLKSDEERPYAIETKAGTAIGVGLEVPEIDRDEMRKVIQDSMGGEAMPPGGEAMPPPGMGGMGGGMGRPGGQRPKLPNGLDIWASLQLATDQTQE